MSRATQRSKTLRTWVRTSTPATWGMRGWMPLLLMVPLLVVGVLWMAPQRIEPQVHAQVQLRMAALGWPPTQVRADGQNVEVWVQSPAVGEPPELAAIRAAVKTTRCPTWAGSWECPERVRVHALAPAAKPMPKEPPAPRPASPPPARSRLHDFHFEVEQGGAVILRGEVESQRAKETIFALAQKTWPERTVQNLLAVSDAPQTTDGPPAAARALDVLGLLTAGHARWQEGRLHVAGSVQAAHRPQAEARFNRERDRPPLGGLTLENIGLDTTQCNAKFAQMLRETSIQFRTASTRITADSQSLLDEIYELALRCPGTLKIEGHTDNVGKLQSNEWLSRARAQAVRQALIFRGLEEQRVHAQGMGPARPIASNKTRAGRAKNRRIEIRIQAPPTTPFNKDSAR